MSKRTKAIALSLILMIVCVGMGYWLYLFLRCLHLPWAREELNHFLILVSGAGLWLGLIIFSSFGVIGQKSQATKLWKGILFGFTWLASIFILLMGGLFGVVMGTMMLDTQTPLGPEAVQIRTIFFGIYLSFLIYATLYLLTIGTRQTLEKGFIAIRDGKFIYPNTVHFVWPFYGYDQTIEKEVRIHLTPSLKCKDGEFMVDAVTSIQLDIEKAQQKGITSLNLRELIMKAGEWVSGIVQDQANKRTFGELLKVEHSPKHREIDGFPIVWPGKVDYVNLVGD